MRKGIAKPEENKGKKLVMPVRTMNVLEAYKALNMGHAIDVIGGYYQSEGILEPDFYMMDRINKLHALAGYKEKLRDSKNEYDAQLKELSEREEKAKLDQLVEQEIQKRINNDDKTKE